MNNKDNEINFCVQIGENDALKAIKAELEMKVEQMSEQIVLNQK